MSESMQTKPGELVPSSNLEPKSEMDQMFAGLGLGSYVSKKDTGAIATGLMSNNASQVIYHEVITKKGFKIIVGESVNLYKTGKIYRFSQKEAR